MIFSESKLIVADNSGAKRIKCIKVLTTHKGKPLDKIVFSIRKIKRSVTITKGSIQSGLIVRLRKNIQRDTGFSIKFSNNSVVLLDQKNVPVGSRIIGPIYKEIKFANFGKLLSIIKITI